MLTKRIITAAIAIPVVIAVIYQGSESAFLVMVMITAALSLFEYCKMYLTNQRWIQVLTVAAGTASIFFIYYYRHALVFDMNEPGRYLPMLFVLLTIAVFSLLLFQMLVFPRNMIFNEPPLIVAIGIVYVSVFLSYLVLLRGKSEGAHWVVLTLLMVWSADIGAFSVGKLWGRHKLSPVTSPNKTVEGALGGLTASVLIAICWTNFFINDLGLIQCVILATGVTLSGLMGDLCESTLKRMNNIKDSSNLLPGHGGMLDRIDSLLFAAPVVFYFNRLIY